MKAYLAGSIFYIGDKFRNDYFASKIRAAFPDIDLYNPLENTEINDKTKFADSNMIANGDNKRLDESDVLFVCIDGDVIPCGSAAEIGKFHDKIMNGEHKYIAGICTDTRQMYLTHSEEKNLAGASAPGEQQYSYQNLYVTGLIKQAGSLSTNIDDAIHNVKLWLGFKE